MFPTVVISLTEVFSMSFEVNMFPLSLLSSSSSKEPPSTLSDPTAAELPLRVWIFWVVALSDPTAWLPLLPPFVLLSYPYLLLILSLGQQFHLLFKTANRWCYGRHSRQSTNFNKGLRVRWLSCSFLAPVCMLVKSSSEGEPGL